MLLHRFVLKTIFSVEEGYKTLNLTALQSDNFTDVAIRHYIKQNSHFNLSHFIENVKLNPAEHALRLVTSNTHSVFPRECYWLIPNEATVKDVSHFLRTFKQRLSMGDVDIRLELNGKIDKTFFLSEIPATVSRQLLPTFHFMRRPIAWFHRYMAGIKHSDYIIWQTCDVPTQAILNYVFDKTIWNIETLSQDLNLPYDKTIMLLRETGYVPFTPTGMRWYQTSRDRDSVKKWLVENEESAENKLLRELLIPMEEINFPYELPTFPKMELTVKKAVTSEPSMELEEAPEKVLSLKKD